MRRFCTNLKYKYCIVFLAFFIFCPLTSAQTFKYTYEYDNAGNRIRRLSEIELKVAKDNSKDNGNNESTDEWESHKETIAGIGIALYPNPTEGELMIVFEDFDSNVTGSISIFDAYGKLIGTKSEFSSYNAIDLSDQPEGIYFIRIEIASEQKTYKVIKH